TQRARRGADPAQRVRWPWPGAIWPGHLARDGKRGVPRADSHGNRGMGRARRLVVAHLPVSPHKVLDLLWSATRRIEGAMQSPLRHADVTLPQLQLLRALARRGHPTRVSDLARDLGCTTSNVVQSARRSSRTGHVERLVYSDRPGWRALRITDVGLDAI